MKKPATWFRGGDSKRAPRRMSLLVNISGFYWGIPEQMPTIRGFEIEASADTFLFARDRAGNRFFLGCSKRGDTWILTPWRAKDGAALTDRRIHIPKE